MTSDVASPTYTVNFSLPCSPFIALGRDVFEKILANIAGEPLHSALVSTDAIRLILPFALCCTQHYDWATAAVLRLSVLPLRFSTIRGTNRHNVRAILPFPAILDPDFQPCVEDGDAMPRLTGVGNISTTDLSRAIACFPNLSTLHLSLAVSVTDDMLQQICSQIRHLKELRIPGNRNVTKTGVKLIADNCYRLQALDLSYCKQLGDECAHSVASILCLKSLDVTYWTISDHFVNVVSKLPHLTNLDLGACNNISDDVCTFLTQSTHGLKRLVLRCSPTLTDQALMKLGPCNELMEIDLSLCRNMTDRGISKLGDPRLFPRLAIVLLSHSSMITDSAIRSLSDNDTIRFVDLSYCPLLTDESAKFLATLPALEEIDLSGCASITDIAVEHVSQLRRLSRLRLLYCRRLTDSIADLLGKNLNATLELLDVRKCRRITSAGLNKLRAVSKQLFY